MGCDRNSRKFLIFQYKRAAPVERPFWWLLIRLLCALGGIALVKIVMDSPARKKTGAWKEVSSKSPALNLFFPLSGVLGSNSIENSETFTQSGALI